MNENVFVVSISPVMSTARYVIVCDPSIGTGNGPVYERVPRTVQRVLDRRDADAGAVGRRVSVTIGER